MSENCLNCGCDKPKHVILIDHTVASKCSGCNHCTGYRDWEVRFCEQCGTIAILPPFRLCVGCEDANAKHSEAADEQRAEFLDGCAERRYERDGSH